MHGIPLHKSPTYVTIPEVAELTTEDGMVGSPPDGALELDVVDEVAVTLTELEDATKLQEPL